MSSRKWRELDPIDVYLGGDLKSWAAKHPAPGDAKAQLFRALAQAPAKPRRRWFFNLRLANSFPVNDEFPELAPRVFSRAMEHYLRSSKVILRPV